MLPTADEALLLAAGLTDYESATSPNHRSNRLKIGAQSRKARQEQPSIRRHVDEECGGFVAPLSNCLCSFFLCGFARSRISVVRPLTLNPLPSGTCCAGGERGQVFRKVRTWSRRATLMARAL